MQQTFNHGMDWTRNILNGNKLLGYQASSKFVHLDILGVLLISCTPFSHKDTLEAYFDSIYMHNHLLQIVCRDQKFKVLNQTQQ
jgi:hypothetical protein